MSVFVLAALAPWGPGARAQFGKGEPEPLGHGPLLRRLPQAETFQPLSEGDVSAEVNLVYDTSKTVLQEYVDDLLEPPGRTVAPC